MWFRVCESEGLIGYIGQKRLLPGSDGVCELGRVSSSLG